jgi:uncharacterized delta-60 repeat protein
MQNLFKSKNALLTALAVLLAPTLVYGQTQSGTLDLSFGTGGKVTTDFAGSGDGAGAIAVQPDGKLVAAGGATINEQVDFALTRYNSDGTLDASFGTGGKVITDFGGRNDLATSVAVQPDGKIVVAVSGLGDFTLARYNN